MIQIQVCQLALLEENFTKEVFSMFSGEKVLVDLRCDNSLWTVMPIVEGTVILISLLFLKKQNKNVTFGE